MGAIHFLGAQPVFEHSHRRVIHSNDTLTTTSGSAVFSNIGARAVTLTVSALGVVSGTNPVLSYSIAEVDPGDKATAYGVSASIANITAAASARSTRIYLRGDTVKVTWSVTGTTPSFAGVYATLTEHTNETENEATALATGTGPWSCTIQMAGRQYAVLSIAAGLAAPNTAECRYSYDNGNAYTAAPLVFDPGTSAYVSSTITFSEAAVTRVIVVPAGTTHVRVAGVTVSGSSSALATLRVSSSGAPWLPQLPLTLGQKTAANSLAVVPASDWVGAFNLSSWIGGSTAPTVGAKAAASSIPFALATDQIPNTVAQAWFSKITNGTITAAIAAASTAAAAADPALVVAPSPNSIAPVLRKDATASAAIGAPGDSVLIDLEGQSAVSFHIAGGFEGAIQPQYQIASSNQWFAGSWADVNPPYTRSSTTTISGMTARAFVIPKGCRRVAAVCTAYTSGSATATLRATAGDGDGISIASWFGSQGCTIGQKTATDSIPVVLASNAALPAGTNNIGDVDVLSLPTLPAGDNNIGNVDVVSLPATPTANLATIASDTTFLRSYNPALPAGTNLIGKVQPSDGTNHVAVKAASTAPVAADPAMVVSVSPNGSPASLITAFAVLNGTTTSMTLTLNGRTSVSFQITNSTFVGELRFQYAYDGGSQYWSGGLVYSSARTRTSALTDPGSGVWYFVLPPGVSIVKVVVQSYTSGQLNGLLSATSSPGDFVNIGQWFNSPAPTIGQKAAASSIPVVWASDTALPAGTNNIGDVDIASWIGGSTAPTVGQKTSANSIPIVPASDWTGAMKRAVASTSTTSNVAASATSVQLLAANANRLGGVIYNDSAAVLTFKYGTTASATSMTEQIQPYESWNLDDGYTGRIDGIWSAATGNARCTELTA